MKEPNIDDRLFMMVDTVFNEVDMALSKNQEEIENQMGENTMINTNEGGKKKNIGRST
jgi:hypothetical protein